MTARKLVGVRIEEVGYGHPDAQRLVAELQQEYVVRYGGPDGDVVEAAQFQAPNGAFLVGYREGRAVASGAWRTVDADGLRGAELKRMYVPPDARGHGLSRLMLAELEKRAAAAGHVRILLETGVHQPEAIALYRSAGYVPIPPYGHYGNDPSALFFTKTL